MFKTAIVAAVLASWVGAVCAEPVLESISPSPKTFIFGPDFLGVLGSGYGDVTAALWAVDLLIQSPPAASASTSGCEAADFAGFVAGSIALIQRGDCLFADKVLNAVTAGAVGVLLFNEGNTDTADRMDATSNQLFNYQSTIPVLFASFDVGNELRSGLLNGDTGAIVHLAFARDDPLIPSIPEPGSLALVGLAIAGAGLAGRRRT